MRGLEEGVATEESVVVLPETVEKAAAKLIARKLKVRNYDQFFLNGSNYNIYIQNMSDFVNLHCYIRL